MQVKERKIHYAYDREGGFSIDNYTEAKPFANFLPAIAGIRGIPLWVFYVNRGQGIAAFGVSDKDHAVMAFEPANRAYETTARRGFRTFIKVMQKKDYAYYEPFQNHLCQQKYDTAQTMRVREALFSVEERNMSLGLEVEAMYFGVPQEPFAALARQLTVKNMLGVPLTLELLDGLPLIQPFGLNEWFAKHMSRTIEGWMRSEISTRKEAAAFYMLKSDPQDRPEYQAVDGAHFFVSFAEKSSKASKAVFPKVITDPEDVFGPKVDFQDPREFLLRTPYNPERPMVLDNKTPCAFGLHTMSLAPGESMKIYSFIGVSRERAVFEKGLNRIASSRYFEEKEKQAKQIVGRIAGTATTISASKRYDDYCRQTFLDNVLRGGWPYVIKDPDRGDVAVHVFSRKHGDLERDYNRFVVQPTYFSQGEGNFRDVNQNRRNDVWYEPCVKDVNVRTFFNLIQPDGFNPLIVEQVKLRSDNMRLLKKRLAKSVNAADLEKLVEFLKQPRTPGEILKELEVFGLDALTDGQDVFETICSVARRWETARHGEGFWSEHWSYNLDLLESYLEVYPEELENILILKKDFTFFDNAHRVKPREHKYVVAGDGKTVRQYGAVFEDEEKAELIASRTEEPDKVRLRNGRGRIYSCSLMTKIVCIIANKYATLDPFGAGVMMDADKPDWFDALNGLPGLLGSSLSETYELLRLARFVRESIGQMRLSPTKAKVLLPVELAQFLHENESATKKFLASRSAGAVQVFWEATHKSKEHYWEKVRFGFRGPELKVPLKKLAKTMALFEKRLEEGIAKVYDPHVDICPTYFINNVADYRLVNSGSKRAAKKAVRVKRFQQHTLPPFLEGPVHALKVEKDPAKCRAIHERVRASDLFDRKLHMYRVCTSMAKETPELGRVRVFSPGWLENESVFLHMEYKWLLELLKKGLLNQFFADFASALVPFQDPKVYGRSILENVSFIASSAFADRKLHGNGFVARLSGSTAEFLDLWLKMNLGRQPFRLNAKRELEFHLNPVLPDWFFTKEDIRREIVTKDGVRLNAALPKSSYAFLLFGRTLISYANPRRIPTFGPRRALVKRISFQDADKKPVVITGGVLPAPYARQLRDGLIRRLDVDLG